MEIIVKLEKERDCFEAIVDGQPCTLEFRTLANDRLEYYHTFVPESLRQRGIASQLAKFALDYAEKNHKKVIPTCGFVKDFIEENIKYKTLIAR